MKLLKTKENKILFRQLKLIKEHRKSHLYFLMLCKILCGGCLPILLAFIPQLFTAWLEKGESPSVLVICALFLGLFIIAAVDIMSYGSLDDSLSWLRREELQKYQRWYQKIDYVHLEDPQFAVRSESAINALGGGSGFFAVYMVFMTLAECAITAIASGILLTGLQPVIVMVCVAAFLIKGKVNHRIGTYIRENVPARAKLERQKSYFSNLGYDFSYGKDVRIFALPKKLMERFRAKSEEYVQNVKKLSFKEMLLGFQTELLLFIRNIVIFLLILISYYRGEIKISQVVLFLGMVIALNTALDRLSDQWVEFVRNAEYASHYFDLMDDTSYIEQPQNTKSPEETIREIQFSKVSFCYPNTSAQVLHNISLTISKGEKIAFVGVNGAGKSTLIKLLTRLFDVKDGAVTVNGININSISKADYYKRFSVVYQDVNVYAGTILENVAGTVSEELDRERAVACLKAMKLDAKIQGLPRGYNTPLLKVIDEEGTEFSGGESQKLSIARALYKDADVYILDEPTSALDALAEKEVFELFNESAKDKTVIYISHRLSSTKFCDRIYLFDGKGLCEMGNHEELLAQKGEYCRMFETQGKYYRKGAK